MSEILILARVKIQDPDLAIIADYYFEVADRLNGVAGSHGLSVWRDERGADSFLICYQYADLESAERGLKIVSEVRLHTELETTDFRPADVQRIVVAQCNAKRLAETPSTAHLSMSVRVADPGYGPELVEELKGILDELQYFPGYIGSLCGANDSLEEEVVGLVTWETRAAFVASLPPGTTMSTLSLYARFF